jgi:tRNA A-37 threonylcarbamoyl transferase component Bud32
MPDNLKSYLKEGVVLHRNDREAGLLLQLSDGRAVKLFPAKGVVLSWFRDVLKQTKAHKQWNSAQKVLAVGLKTPEPLSVEVFSPSSEYESAYIYRYLEEAQTFLDFFNESENRSELLADLARQIALMAREDVLVIDLHLSNLLVDDEGQIWWIDLEITENKRLIRKKFWQRIGSVDCAGVRSV